MGEDILSVSKYLHTHTHTQIEWEWKDSETKTNKQKNTHKEFGNYFSPLRVFWFSAPEDQFTVSAKSKRNDFVCSVREPFDLERFTVEGERHFTCVIDIPMASLLEMRETPHGLIIYEQTPCGAWIQFSGIKLLAANYIFRVIIAAHCSTSNDFSMKIIFLRFIGMSVKEKR